MFFDNGKRFGFVFALSAFIVIVSIALITSVPVTSAAPSSSDNTELHDVCGHSLDRPPGFIARHFDVKFWKKFAKHLIPFTSGPRVKMHFYLYKKDFRECGRPIDPEDDSTLERSGFNVDHQTRIIIHGWMSQGRGKWYRALRDAYLDLAHDWNELHAPNDANATLNGDVNNNNNSSLINNSNNAEANDVPAWTMSSTNYTDFNIIVVDWSTISTNVNYFEVVEYIDDLGFLLAEFVRYLNMRTGLNYDDIYLIGHSLGAQIAGSAGKHSKPFLFNTIYALDPAGPKFRDSTDDRRLDPSDAKYVESIQTSTTFGFTDPVGHASFYPNFGHAQTKCHIYDIRCSHSRSHDYFAESITSKKGFWGTLCKREADGVWILSDSGTEFRMGGEPSIPKRGTFYVKTNDRPPYALGRNALLTSDMVLEAEVKS